MGGVEGVVAQGEGAEQTALDRRPEGHHSCRRSISTYCTISIGEEHKF